MPNCTRCGGLHYGSNECPFLGPATCFNCDKPIVAEEGSDFSVHPGRKFDSRGRVYHPKCKFQPEKMGFWESIRAKERAAHA